MKSKNLIKLIVGVTLVTVLAVALPLAGGCAPKPAAPPEAAPPEVAPPEVAPPEEVVPPEPAVEEPTWTFRAQEIGSAADIAIHFTPWVEWVEKMTAGRVHIDMFSSSELVPDDMILPALQTGGLDIGLYTSVCNPSLTKLGEIGTCLIMGTQNQNEMMCLYKHRGLEDIVREDYAEYGGIYYVSPMFFDPAITLISTKPIETYEDLDGLKLSGWESLIRPFYDAGASVVTIPLEECYLAGTTGVVEAVAGYGGAPFYYYNAWHEVYPYLLDESMGNFTLEMIFSEEVWNSLPEDIQAIFYVSASWMTEHSQNLYYNDTSFYRAEAFTVTKFSREDHQKLVDHAMEYWDELSQKNERLAQVIEIYRAYNEEVEKARWHR